MAQEVDRQFVDYDVDDEIINSSDEKQKLVSFVHQQEERLSREKSRYCKVKIIMPTLYLFC